MPDAIETELFGTEGNMTRNAFLAFVTGVTLYYLTLVIVAIYGYAANPDEWSIETRFIKDFVAILTALPAALLAFAVQQRLVFIKEVRDSYKDCVAAIEDAIYFCRRTTLDEDEKLSVLKGLSVAIERVRAVYSDRNSTNYPVIGLHKIYQIVNKVRKESEMPSSHDEIIRLWKPTRQIFLTEIDRGDRRLSYKDQYTMLHPNK
ncbi:hypothetical protein [Deinococcus sp. 12RED42]|uniref:hypothetical protein n=1 Tax=Deinococcus sp. 12RED42 TaxID=2745872 RepID=UPI001E38E14F|nr:hypothetical protein [Deinococcus sp. 12RED42]MCD0164241.1 hypothetical protein [Deinococcus sp. 12RED42]